MFPHCLKLPKHLNLPLPGVNITKLCGLHDGTVFIPVYDWVTHLSPFFKKTPDIKCYQQFHFSSNAPGKVFLRQYADSTEKEFTLLTNPSDIPPAALPPVIKPLGLTPERKSNRCKEIRAFCKYGTEDLVAPKP